MFKKYSLGAVCILSLLILSLWYIFESSEEENIQLEQITVSYYKDIAASPIVYSQAYIKPNLVPIDFGILLNPPKINQPVAIVKKTESIIPEWILEGILMKETRSFYKDNGDICYKDKRRGAAGERGPFQMTPIAFEQVAKKGEQFWKIEKDLDFAQEMAERYLTYLYKNCAHKNWRTAVMMYNTGPTNYYKLRTIAMAYYNDVKSKCE